jgi:predicted nucleic acid-binding protein
VIVADTNLVAYLLIEDEQTPQALQLKAKNLTWLMPGFWRIEFLNIVSAYVRTGRFSRAEGMDLIHRSRRLTHVKDMAVDETDALDLAEQHKISGYDALFLALAKSQRCKLISADKKLAAVAPQHCALLRDFLA